MNRLCNFRRMGCLVFALALCGCSLEAKQKIADLSGMDSDSNSDSDSDGTDSGTDQNPIYSGTLICKGDTDEVQRDSVALMILQDMSGSMAGYNWPTVRPTIIELLTQYQDSMIRFGFDMFPDDGLCGFGRPLLMDSQLDRSQAEEIIALLPPGGAPNGSTPLYEAMRNFLNQDYAPGFLSDGRDRYLLVVSDGADTCGTIYGEFPTAQDFSLLTQDLLATGVKTFTIGFGDGVDAGELNAIAAAGGTQFTSFIAAEDYASLTDAFSMITGQVVACDFEVLEPAPGTDTEEANFYLNDQLVPRDQDCLEEKGWDWIDGSGRKIHFCSQPCRILRTREDRITVQWGCPQVSVTEN